MNELSVVVHLPDGTQHFPESLVLWERAADNEYVYLRGKFYKIGGTLWDTAHSVQHIRLVNLCMTDAVIEPMVKYVEKLDKEDE